MPASVPLHVSTMPALQPKSKNVNFRIYIEDLKADSCVGKAFLLLCLKPFFFFIRNIQYNSKCNRWVED